MGFPARSGYAFCKNLCNLSIICVISYNKVGRVVGIIKRNARLTLLAGTVIIDEGKETKGRKDTRAQEHKLGRR